MMHRLSIRFLLSYLGVVVLAICTLSVYTHYHLKTHFMKNLEQDLYQTGRVIAAIVASQPVSESLDTLCVQIKEWSGVRVTFIGTDGRVWGDSERSASSFENHLYRPEVQQALEKGTGSSVHVSRTLGYPMLYSAILASSHDRAYLLRLSVPLERVSSDLATIRSDIIYGGLLAFVLSAPLLYLFSSTMSRRIMRLRDFVRAARQGDRHSCLYVGSRDELGDLEGELDKLAASLDTHVHELTLERSRLQGIFETIQDGIVLLDPQDRMLFINPSAAGILGLATEASLGQSLLEAVRSKELYELVQAVRGTEHFPDVREVVFLKNPDKNYLASASGIRAPKEGALMGCLIVLRDITESKRLDKIRADFVTHVSHELRTPLTLVKGYAETLQEEGFSNEEQAARFLSIIRENTDRLVRLVNDLLRLSSIELGRLPVRMEPVRLEELVNQTSRAFESRAAEKEVTLTSSFPAGLPPVVADPDRLAEVLINIYDNAIKYTDTGEVSASAIYIAPDAGHPVARVGLNISDTGIGIPAREIARVTERFYRCDRDVPQEDKGSGLGLAIVKHLVKLMDGELSISSKEHAGTTVTIVFPVSSEVTPKNFS